MIFWFYILISCRPCFRPRMPCANAYIIQCENSAKQGLFHSSYRYYSQQALSTNFHGLLVLSNESHCSIRSYRRWSIAGPWVAERYYCNNVVWMCEHTIMLVCGHHRDKVLCMKGGINEDGMADLLFSFLDICVIVVVIDLWITVVPSREFNTLSFSHQVVLRVGTLHYSSRGEKTSLLWQRDELTVNTLCVLWNELG